MDSNRLPYAHWRREYRSYSRDDELPDMNAQSLGLKCYRRRQKGEASSTIRRGLASEAAEELDLDETQAEELVASVKQWNPNATLWDVCQEHYSDRAAVLQALIDTRRKQLGHAEDLIDVAVKTLDELKSIEGKGSIAGLSRPIAREHVRDWAAQRIKEECMLLEAIRTNLVPDHMTSDHCLQLLRICVREFPEENRALMELSSPSLRRKEQTRLERAWYAVLLPFVVTVGDGTPDILGMLRTDSGGNALVDDEEQRGYNGSIPPFMIPFIVAHGSSNTETVEMVDPEQLTAGLNKLLKVFAPNVLPQPDTFERAALRMFMNSCVQTILQVLGLEIPSSIWNSIEMLCGLGFGYGEAEACKAFWSGAFPDLVAIWNASADRASSSQSLFGYFAAQLSFGCVNELQTYSSAYPVLKQLLEGPIRSMDYRVASEMECRMILPRLIYETGQIMALAAYQAQMQAAGTSWELSPEQQQDFEVKVRVLIRLVITASQASEGRSSIKKRKTTAGIESIVKSDDDNESEPDESLELLNQVCVAGLRCLRELCLVSPQCRAAVLESQQSLETAGTDVLNSVLATATAQDCTEQILMECLLLCLVILGAGDNNNNENSTALSSFKRDCSILVSRSLVRHRRLSKYEQNIMSEAYDVETSVLAVKIAEKLKRVDMEDAEILVQLLESPQSSERLANAARLALGEINTECWAPVVLNRRTILFLFKIMPETDAQLLFKVVQYLAAGATDPATNKQRVSLLGLLGPETLDLCRRQMLESLRTLDVYAVDFLMISLTTTEPELGWTFFIYSNVSMCLSMWIVEERFIDDDPRVVHGFERVVLLLRTLLTNAQFKGWFLAKNPSFLDNIVQITEQSEDWREDQVKNADGLITKRLCSRAHMLAILSANLGTILTNSSLRPRVESTLLNFPSKQCLSILAATDRNVLCLWIASWVELGNKLLSAAVATATTTANTNKDDQDLQELLIGMTRTSFLARQSQTVVNRILFPLVAFLSEVSSSSEILAVVADALAFTVQSSGEAIEKQQAEQLAKMLATALLKIPSSLLTVPTMAGTMAKLCSVFIRLGGEGSEFLQQERSELLPLSCELFLNGPTQSSNALLFCECCAESLSDESVFHAFRDAITIAVNKIRLASSSSCSGGGDSGDLNRMLLRAMAKIARKGPLNHVRLLVDIGLVTSLPLARVTSLNDLNSGGGGAGGDENQRRSLSRFCIADQLELVCSLLRRGIRDLESGPAKTRLVKDCTDCCLKNPETRQLLIQALRQLRNHRQCVFTLSKLRDIRAIALTIRLLLGVSANYSLPNTGELLQELFQTIGDLVECGSREQGLKVGLLDEFSDQMYLEMRKRTSRQVSRLVLKSVCETAWEKRLDSQPFQELGLIRSAHSGGDLSFTSDGQHSTMMIGGLDGTTGATGGIASPMMSPIRSSSVSSSIGASDLVSVNSPLMVRALSSSSPRPGGTTPQLSSSSSAAANAQSLSSSPPRTITMFHVEVEIQIERCLQELFLLFTVDVPTMFSVNSGKQGSRKKPVLFAVSSSDNVSPDLSTLLSGLWWIRKTLKQRSYSTTRAELACSIAFALYQALKGLSSLSGDDAQRKSLEGIRKVLFGDSLSSSSSSVTSTSGTNKSAAAVAVRDQGIFSSLTSRMREENDQSSAETMQTIANQVKMTMESLLGVK